MKNNETNKKKPIKLQHEASDKHTTRHLEAHSATKVL